MSPSAHDRDATRGDTPSSETRTDPYVDVPRLSHSTSPGVIFLVHRCVSAGLRTSSLAYQNGVFTSAVITVLVCFAHGFFYYAQIFGQDKECGFVDPMTNQTVVCPSEIAFDGLLAGILSVNFNYDAAGALGLAVETASTEMCYQKGIYVECSAGRGTPIMTPYAHLALACICVTAQQPTLACLAHHSSTFACAACGSGENVTGDLCTALECSGGAIEKPVIHVSYWYSLVRMHNPRRVFPFSASSSCSVPHTNAASLARFVLRWQSHLWSQPGETHPDGTKDHPGRLPAALIFIFSFMWPHVKLILLHTFYYLPKQPGPRRNALYWFSFFGKWSLADVLVMCAPGHTHAPGCVDMACSRGISSHPAVHTLMAPSAPCMTDLASLGGNDTLR